MGTVSEMKRRRPRRQGAWVKIRRGAGSFIRDARKARNLTQLELGRLCDCSQTTIYMLETESHRLPTVSYELASKVCKYTGLKMVSTFDASTPTDMPDPTTGWSGTRQPKRKKAA